jgi:NTE family protein
LPQTVGQKISSLADYVSKTAEKIPIGYPSIFSSALEKGPSPPHMLIVLGNSIKIMQHRLTISRLSADPPEVELCPKLTGMDMFDFGKAEYAIEQGIIVVEKNLKVIKEAIEETKTKERNAK